MPIKLGTIVSSVCKLLNGQIKNLKEYIDNIVIDVRRREIFEHEYKNPKTGETIYYNVKTGKKVDIDPRTGKPVGTNVATRYISKGLEWRDKLGFGGGEGPSIFEAIKDPEKMEEYVKTKIENADSKSIIGQTRDALKDPEQLAKNARAYKSGDLNKEDVTIPIRVMSNLLDIDDAIKTGEPEEFKKVLNI